MPVTDYFGQTAYAGRISELAINEALVDYITALGAVPVRTGAQLQAQDTYPRLIEQALGLTSPGVIGGLGWAANARAVVGADVTVLAASDDGMFIDADPAAGGMNRLVNLPAAAALRQGWNFVVRKGGPIGSPETLTLTPNGADTIDGETVLNQTFDALLVVRVGATAWRSIRIATWPGLFLGTDDGSDITVAPALQGPARGVIIAAATPTGGGAQAGASVGIVASGGINGAGAGDIALTAGRSSGAAIAGGGITLAAGMGSTAGSTGGPIAITGGQGTNGVAPGGGITVTGGAGIGTGGAVTITGGAAGNSGDGGAVSLIGGAATAGVGDGGNAIIRGGTSVGGAAGSVFVGMSNTRQVNICSITTSLSMFGAGGATQQTVVGAKGGNAALTSLLAALAAYGLIIDSTT